MPHRSQLRFHGFKLPKRGHTAEEYEDAYAAEPEVGRFAVADGASESSFAGMWAKLLVEGFVRPPKDVPLEGDWRAPLRQRWAEAVDAKKLPWFAEEKREMGAFATFLGLTIKQAKAGTGGRWQAISVGDSCLFQVRQDHLLEAFPLSKSQDFGTRPALIGSRETPAQVATAPGKIEWGRWNPGDRLFLMTDALAQWFLARHEAKLMPWHSIGKRLAEPKGDAVFAAYLEQQRDQQQLKNDDVTMLVIDLFVARAPDDKEAKPEKA
jgi:hypothetical protein